MPASASALQWEFNSFVVFQNVSKGKNRQIHAVTQIQKPGEIQRWVDLRFCPRSIPESWQFIPSAPGFLFGKSPAPSPRVCLQGLGALTRVLLSGGIFSTLRTQGWWWDIFWLRLTWSNKPEQIFHLFLIYTLSETCVAAWNVNLNFIPHYFNAKKLGNCSQCDVCGKNVAQNRVDIGWYPALLFFFPINFRDWTLHSSQEGVTRNHQLNTTSTGLEHFL